MKAKRAFVPEALATLEDRAVPALFVLSTQTYVNVIRAIDASFHLYGSNFNVGNLATHLVNSVNPIPLAAFSGLNNQMVAIALQTQANVINRVPFPLVTQENAAIAAVNNVIAYEVATGITVIV
jgi:hypothetical protein